MEESTKYEIPSIGKSLFPGQGTNACPIQNSVLVHPIPISHRVPSLLSVPLSSQSYNKQFLSSHPKLQLASPSFFSKASPSAFCAALRLDWICRTYSATTTWNFGASLLVEVTLRPAFLSALVTCFSAFCRWTEQREGTAALNIGFMQKVGPVVELWNKQLCN